MNKMKEYLIFKIYRKVEDTQDKLNRMAMQGWKLICSYAYNNEYLVMEREKENE